MTNIRGNEAAIREMMTSIARDPGSWDMGEWSRETECGTTYCAAGYAVMSAGHNFLFRETKAYLTTDGLAIGPLAQDILGLDERQAAAIFFASGYCEACEVLEDDHELECCYGYDSDELRHPTVREFADRVTDITGVEFKDEDLTSD